MSGSDLVNSRGRTALSPSTPLWLWLVQRISGLLLGPLLLVHILVPGAPYMAWLGGLLLATIVAHGYAGLMRLAFSKGLSAALRRVAYWLIVIVLLAVLLLGGAIVASLM